MPVYTNMHGTRRYMQETTEEGGHMDEWEDKEGRPKQPWAHPEPTQRQEPMSETGEEQDKVQAFQPMKRIEPITPIDKD